MTTLAGEVAASFIGVIIGLIFTFAVLWYVFPAWSTLQVFILSVFISLGHV